MDENHVPRRHVYAIWLGMFLVCWIGLTLLCALVGQLAGGHWIELFNGATWPSQFYPGGSSPTSGQGFWFFVFLGLRTLLNLGFLFTAGGVVYLFYYGMQGNFMHKFNATFRSSNLTLANKIILVLAQNGVELTAKQRQLVHDEAVNFGNDSQPSSALRKQVAEDALAGSDH